MSRPDTRRGGSRALSAGAEGAALRSGVITGELKSRIDNIWNAFWSGGISNPLEVIEQITYLLFLRRLDDLHTHPLRSQRVKARPSAGSSVRCQRSRTG